ncbi:hypothetical protein ENTCAN_09430 [Enterobacter cancerogenus ATCC 35316]|nr:hypothetical protein ENTCAN_09430 [Enterobacter cancerogenus ATCC 35316]
MKRCVSVVDFRQVALRLPGLRFCKPGKAKPPPGKTTSLL